MKIIVRGRDSGKARELIAAARDAKAIIATDDVERLRNKANRYGIYDVDICSYDDIISVDQEYADYPIMIHNVDKFLECYFGMTGQKIIGFSATLEEKKKKLTHFKCPDCGKEWDEEVPDEWHGLAVNETLCEDCSNREIHRFMES